MLDIDTVLILRSWPSGRTAGGRVPGHNHSVGCMCGWCYKTGSGSYREALYVSTPTVRAFKRLESFTVPNALCPVCGAAVFFYQSLAGSRVFFDELGPPWPKHPCTDNGRKVQLATGSSSSSRPTPGWAGEGWMPIDVKSSSMIGSWHLVPIEIFERRSHLVVLSADPVRVPNQFCAAFDGFDSSGHAIISIVDLDAPGSARLIEVFDAGRFAAMSAFDARKARRRS